MPIISIWTRLGIYAVCVAAIFLGALRLHEDGYNAGVASATAQVTAANDKADRANKAAQAASDLKASADNAILTSKMDTILSRLKGLNAPVVVGKPTTKLASDCIYDDARIKWANEE